MADKIMAPKDVYILILRTCKCFRTWQKGLCNFIKLKETEIWPWHRKIILDYPSRGSNVITSILMNERQEDQSEKGTWCWKKSESDLKCYTAGLKTKEGNMRNAGGL